MKILQQKSEKVKINREIQGYLTPEVLKLQKSLHQIQQLIIQKKEKHTVVKLENQNFELEKYSKKKDKSSQNQKFYHLTIFHSFLQTLLSNSESLHLIHWKDPKEGSFWSTKKK